MGNWANPLLATGVLPIGANADMPTSLTSFARRAGIEPDCGGERRCLFLGAWELLRSRPDVGGKDEAARGSHGIGRLGGVSAALRIRAAAKQRSTDRRVPRASDRAGRPRSGR